ncbi:MAG: DUF2934 domain-containing protein [Alphaproteobacteria bacterium]|nr:DUF2934 domain-containing protein [Alphaproteobacteria bacterium]
MTKQLNQEHIRVAAYYEWQNAGCPSGRDQEFWYLACNKVCGCGNVASKNNVKNNVKSKASSVKLNTKKVVAKPVVKKNANVKPAVVAKPFYGVKK